MPCIELISAILIPNGGRRFEISSQVTQDSRIVTNPSESPRGLYHRVNCRQEMNNWYKASLVTGVAAVGAVLAAWINQAVNKIVVCVLKTPSMTDFLSIGINELLGKKQVWEKNQDDFRQDSWVTDCDDNLQRCATFPVAPNMLVSTIGPFIKDVHPCLVPWKKDSDGNPVCCPKNQISKCHGATAW